MSLLASRPVTNVANPQIAVRETSGTSNNATIFLRIDFPRKRMASPSSGPERPREWPRGTHVRQQTARAYY
ncbi:hypothetical protein GCM10018785_52740 [Streptomyces longispororuber]|uniref:Uncharacterized protein n=1 Tax=Streptomyces longispororuber TaxID=68230 RepID=A0A919A042_9ACTN|nr:hypothetical protein GCM10018785_52740 [Streptomyces longispororuber]